MTTCPFCDRQFDGIAAACPHCGRDLPPAGLLTAPTPPAKTRIGRKRLAVAITIGILVGVALLAAGFYIDLMLHFCFELNFGDAEPANSCADEERGMLLWFWFAVVPIALLGGIGSGLGIAHIFRRRSRRPPA